MSKELAVFKVPELKPLKKTEADLIIEAFTPKVVELSEQDEEFNSIIAEAKNGITEELSKRAKRCRLDHVPIRTGTAKVKDEQKEDIKLKDKAIMAVTNFITKNIQDREAELLVIEQHLELIEKARIEKLTAKRLELLEPYKEYVLGGNLGALSEEDFAKVFNGAKLQFEDAQRRLKEEEDARLAEELKLRLERELFDKRQAELRPYYSYSKSNFELKGMSEEDYQAKLAELKELKKQDDVRQAEIQAENDRLRKEQESKDKIAEEERQKRLALEKELQDKKDAEERKKREDAAALEAELAKGDAEKWKDLRDDLIALKTKYSFDAEENKTSYRGIGYSLDNIIVKIK